MSDAMLEVSGLVVSIDRHRILNGLDLRVGAGETVGLIGPNGSGKTTLFNALNGFHQPRSGSIRFRGEDVTRAAPFERARRGLGRVFQNSGVFREMTVLENMVTGLESHRSIWPTFLPWSRQHRQDRERAGELLSEVGLAGKAGDKAGSLSGGQLRLLEIQRTLAFGAELLLLDEPTAGVSPRMKVDVANLILKVKGLGRTVLVIEHDLNFIEKFCDRILVLDGGRVILDGSPEEVRKSALLQEIYFGTTR